MGAGFIGKQSRKCILAQRRNIDPRKLDGCPRSQCCTRSAFWQKIIQRKSVMGRLSSSYGKEEMNNFPTPNHNLFPRRRRKTSIKTIWRGRQAPFCTPLEGEAFDGRRTLNDRLFRRLALKMAQLQQTDSSTGGTDRQFRFQTGQFTASSDRNRTGTGQVSDRF